MKFPTHLQYEHTEVAVDLFSENVALVHYLVVVCIYVSSFFLYLKECVVILEFGSTVLYRLARKTRRIKQKVIAYCTDLLDYTKCATLNSGFYTQWFLYPMAVKTKGCMGE